MPAPYIISSSILSADFSSLGEQIHAAEAGGIDGIHVDVMDGHFVPNITMGPFIVETCRRITSLPIDVHLMIEHPERFVDDFVHAGASQIYVHIEGNPNIYRTLEHIKSLGCKAGIVLNPGTPGSAIQAVLHKVDIVLVMTVNPGYSGQAFIPDEIPKVAMVRKALDQVNPGAMIAVDGGITAETLPQILVAGAQWFIVATAIYKYPEGIAAGIRALKEQFPD